MSFTDHKPGRWTRRVLSAILVTTMALITSVIFSPAAYARPAKIDVAFSGPSEIKITDSPLTVNVTLTNSSPRDKAEGVGASIALEGDASNYASIQIQKGSCDSAGADSVNCAEIEKRQSKQFSIVVTPKSGTTLNEGQKAGGNIVVRISPPNNGDKGHPMSIIGAKQVAPEMKGVITNLQQEPLAGVEVSAKDKNGTNFGPTHTGDDGSFLITGDFAPGDVTVTLKKEGYEDLEETLVAVAGQSISANLRMTEAAVESDESEAAPEEQPAAVDNKPEDNGLSTTMWLLIILGGLLVLGGIGAIIMLFMRGKNDPKDDDETLLPDVQPIHRPSATQTGHLGVYDAAARRPGMDAPTMIHSGPLIADDDLARYGNADIPTSSGGYGAAYDETRPTSGNYGSSNTPTSSGGYGAAYDETRPTSGGFGPSYDDRRSGSSYPSERQGSSSWGSSYDQGGGQTSRYGQAPDPGYGGGQQPEQQYGGGQQPGQQYGGDSTHGRTSRYDQSDDGYGAGYGERPTRGRRYRDDDEEEPPRRW